MPVSRPGRGIRQRRERRKSGEKEKKAEGRARRDVPRGMSPGQRHPREKERRTEIETSERAAETRQINVPTVILRMPEAVIAEKESLGKTLRERKRENLDAPWTCEPETVRDGNVNATGNEDYVTKIAAS